MKNYITKSFKKEMKILSPCPYVFYFIGDLMNIYGFIINSLRSLVRRRRIRALCDSPKAS